MNKTLDGLHRRRSLDGRLRRAATTRPALVSSSRSPCQAWGLAPTIRTTSASSPASTYYFTDRNNAAVDAIDIPTLKVTSQITGVPAPTPSPALKPSNANSGPDGLNVVGTQLYAGDVNSVKVIDPNTRQVVKTIVVGAMPVSEPTKAATTRFTVST